MLIIVAALALIAYGFFKEVKIDQDIDSIPLSAFQLSEEVNRQSSSTLLKRELRFDLDPYIFMIVFLIFVGWFIFVVFCGIGLTALPLDLILDYFGRPRQQTATQLAKTRIILREKTDALMHKMKELEGDYNDLEYAGDTRGWFGFGSKSRKFKKQKARLSQNIEKLEQVYDIYKKESEVNSNPLVYLCYLLVGIFLFVVNFFLILHVVLYRIIYKDGEPLNRFLNDFLVWVEFDIARFFSTLILLLIGVDLLFCTLKGNVKFGLRIFILFGTIHKIKLRETFMNTFLFNLGLVLLATPVILHFQMDIFAYYLTNRTYAFFFVEVFRNMDFFKFFYDKKIFYYALLIWSLLAFVYLMFRPRKDRINVQELVEKIDIKTR